MYYCRLIIQDQVIDFDQSRARILGSEQSLLRIKTDETKYIIGLLYHSHWNDIYCLLSTMFYGLLSTMFYCLLSTMFYCLLSTMFYGLLSTMFYGLLSTMFYGLLSTYS